MKRLLCLAILVPWVVCLAQPSPDTLWTRTYGGSGSEEAYCIEQTTDGGYVVAGYTWMYGADTQQCYVVKLDSVGDTLWTKLYGGIDWEEAESIQQTTDGGYIIAGMTASYGAGGGDFYLVKTNSAGDTLWTKAFGSYSWDFARSVVQTTDGGYVVAGYVTGLGAGSDDFYAVKTDSLGEILWAHTYGGSYNDEACRILQTSDGGYVIVGWTESFGVRGRDFYVVKTDERGDTLWTRTYGGVSNDYATSVQQTSDDGFLIAGHTGISQSYTCVVRTDSHGDTLWTRTYGGSGNDYARSIQRTADGGYVIAGSGDSFPDTVDVFAMKISAQGDSLWTRTYGGSDLDGARSIQQTTDGGYVIAGWTYSYGAGNEDFYVVKTGPDSLVPNVARPLSLHPSSFILSAYPNPFNPTTTISFSLEKAGRVRVEVFDVLGRDVQTLTNQILPAGVHRVVFDGTGLASGIYFARVKAGGMVRTQKMVLLK